MPFLISRASKGTDDDDEEDGFQSSSEPDSDLE